MSDFSDRPFVAGSLVGLRAFSVDKYGRLIGPSFGGVFKPGENEAGCHSVQRRMAGLPAGSEVEAKWDQVGWGTVRLNAPTLYSVRLPDGEERQFASVEAIEEAYPPPADEHPVGAADCSCGYYAYFDGLNDYGQHDRVTAVVEGYGVCTVGDRGFRASKARIVAFVRPEAEKVEAVEPPPAKQRTLWNRVYPHGWNGFLVALNAAFAARAAISGEWWWQFALSASCSALIALAWIATIVAQGSAKKSKQSYERLRKELTRYSPPPKPLTTVQWSVIERNYPDVPMYPSQEAALAAHPLTTPPPLTPDEPDFWTRPVDE